MAASLTPRFGNAPKDNNTSQVLTNKFLTPAYAASVALKPNAAKTIAVFAQLTGALSVTADTTQGFAGDELLLLFATDATQRIVTASTGLNTSGTLTIPASKKGSLSFVFDGATWVETGRCITA